jgi:hypothetical protein
MVTVDAMATRQQLAHLLRRATFGPRASEVDAAERAGFEPTMGGSMSTPMPALGLAKDREQVRAGVLWWVDRMVAAENQVAEKLVFFWHGHWATSVRKVRSPGLMLGQQKTFREYGGGDFGAFVKAMLRDPALIVWLDGQRNTRKAPNENLARELMELFTLGVGPYTEDDVKAGARALTGWQLDRDAGRLVFNPKRHDPGVKTILGRSGAFDADGFAEVLLAQPALADQLDLVARCVEAKVATRVFSVSLGGFDTHAEEKATQQRLLSELDTAVSRFADRMTRTEAGRRVVVAIYSEFGRRVRANASQGTDHGTASNVFLLGARVHGGLYATLLGDVLDTDPGRVLADWPGRLADVFG